MFKTTKKILASLLAILMVVGVGGTTVFAANYTPISGGTTKLEKYLVVESDAEIPEAEFTFTMSAGNAVEATEGTVKTWAGLHPELVKVNGTAGSGKVNFVAGEAATAGPLEGVATADQKYAKKEIVLDFSDSGIQFNEPGIFRYRLTENSAAQGSPIKHDEESVRTIDVYVEDREGALVVAGYVVYEGAVEDAAKTLPSPIALPDLTEWDAQNPAPAVVANPGERPVPVDSENPTPEETAAMTAWDAAKADYDAYLVAKEAYDANRAAETARQEAANLAAATAKTPTNGAEASTPKNNKYVNTMDSADLKVKKTVSGNQGSHDEYFEFTITVNNAGAGTVMTLDMSGAELATHENTATSFTKATMDAANQKDDNSKWTYKGTEYESESAAHAAAIQDIDSVSAAPKFVFNGVEYDTEEAAENAAKAACIAPKAGQQIIADENGDVTFKVYLHHGQEAVLKGLPVGATYTVAETAAAGYETKYNVKVGAEDAVEMEAVADEEIGAEDVEVDTINRRNGILPTGVIMSIGAPLAIGALATGLFLARRKKDEDEE